MGQFSLTHWIIVLMILVPTVALPIIPGWRITRKAGFNGAWCLLLLVPGVNVLAIWAFAFTRWPNSQDGNDRTSVGAMVWGALLLAMMVLGIVLLPMLEKQVTPAGQQDAPAQKQQAQPSADDWWRKGSIAVPESGKAFTYEEAQSWSGNPFDKFDTPDQQAARALEKAPDVFSGSPEKLNLLNVAMKTWTTYAKNRGLPEGEAFHYSVAQLIYGARNGWGACSYAGDTPQGSPKLSCTQFPSSR